MRRVLQFLHPARDFRCDFRVILEDAASLCAPCGVEVLSDNGDSCCILKTAYDVQWPRIESEMQVRKQALAVMTT
jgi:hypothetical protein